MFVAAETKREGCEQKGTNMTLSLTKTLPLAAAMTLSLASLASAGEIFTTKGIAINGYDPVAYFTEHKPVKGNDRYAATHRGAKFLFSSAKHRDLFTANPDSFAPQYGGYCAYGTARGYKATTVPQAFTVVDDKLYLNYNDSVAKTWRKDIVGYVAKADENWDTVKTQPEP
jgi:YHS domain-containing protein